jgi:hypothetical protein
MKQRPSKAWWIFLNVATVFSFIVNVILVLVLLLTIGPLRQLLGNLDQAFLGLGETDVTTTVPVNQPIDISFDLPLDQSMGLDFDLPIAQETEAVLTRPVPMRAPATFVLPGWGGAINGTVSLDLPQGMRLPVWLDMQVPVERTIPVSMTVPVSETVTVEMAIPVTIQLGDAGLDPAVQELRDVFAPLRALVDRAWATLRILWAEDTG